MIGSFIGDPGTGKTRLAGTFRKPLFIDTEDGAASAHPGQVNRIKVPVTANILKDVEKIFDQIIRSPYDEKTRTVRFSHDQVGEVDVATVVLDTIDPVQDGIKIFKILTGSRTKMQQSDWGDLLTYMQPLMYKWFNVPTTVIINAHVRTKQSDDSPVAEATYSVQGSLSAMLPRQFAWILHVKSGEKGRRTVLTQPMTLRRGKTTVKFTAKDKHEIFRSLADDKYGTVPVDLRDDGWPSRKIAEAVESFVAERE